jgi:hypothetical protein
MNFTIHVQLAHPVQLSINKFTVDVIAVIIIITTTTHYVFAIDTFIIFVETTVFVNGQ